MSYATVRIAPSRRVKAACIASSPSSTRVMFAMAFGFFYAAFAVLAIIARLIEVARP